jgi:hypothetical protein
VSSTQAIKTLVKNLEETGSTLKKTIGSGKSVCTAENVARMKGSASRRVVSLGSTDRSVRRILHRALHYNPYKIQTAQVLKDVDHANRLAFCQKLLNIINENQDLVLNLLMRDEAYFHLSGFVNKQNFRYWSSETPQTFHGKRLHISKVRV